MAAYAKTLDDTRSAFEAAIQLYVSIIQTKTSTENSMRIAEFCRNGVCRPFGASGLGTAAPQK